MLRSLGESISEKHVKAGLNLTLTLTPDWENPDWENPNPNPNPNKAFMALLDQNGDESISFPEFVVFMVEAEDPIRVRVKVRSFHGRSRGSN